MSNSKSFIKIRSSNLTNAIDLEKIEEEYYNQFHPPHDRKEKRMSFRDKETLTKLSAMKKQKGVIKQTLISVLVVLYILPNPSIMTFLSRGRIDDLSSGAASNNNESKQLIRSSIFSYVAANPSPEPAAARSRTSAKSSSHKMPPMNGSIFGKRSLKGSTTTTTTSNNNVANTIHNSYNDIDLAAAARGSGSGGEDSNVVDDNSISDRNRVQRPKVNNSFDNVARNEAWTYKDIITEIIEDFLASNNESDPEETTVSFCRMIVYECSQILTEQSRASIRRRRANKRTQ